MCCPEGNATSIQINGYLFLLKRTFVKQIEETIERQNSSYACVINTKLKLNIFHVWENIPDFVKRYKKLSFQNIKYKPNERRGKENNWPTFKKIIDQFF